MRQSQKQEFNLLLFPLIFSGNLRKVPVEKWGINIGLEMLKEHSHLPLLLTCLINNIMMLNLRVFVPGLLLP